MTTVTDIIGHQLGVVEGRGHHHILDYRRHDVLDNDCLICGRICRSYVCAPCAIAGHADRILPEPERTEAAR